jgi:hypothetical protein
MTAGFNWNNFKGLNDVKGQQPLINGSTENKEDFWNQFKNFDKKKSYIKNEFSKEALKETAIETGKGMVRIGATGLNTYLAAPSKGIGGLLQTLSSIGNEGEEGEIKGMGTKLISKAGEWFSKIGNEGQAQIKADIEKYLGKPYGTAEEALTNFVEKYADIRGSLPIKGMNVPALSGAGLSEIGKQLGASESTQQALETIGMVGRDLGKGIASLIKEKTTSPSGLQLPKIVEKIGEKIKGLKAKVFSGKKAEVYKNVSEQSEKLINEIRNERLPLAKEIEEGVDVEGKINENLSKVQSLAKKLPMKIESNLISDYLDTVEQKIQFGGIPTNEQEDILKVIEKYRKAYQVSPSGTRMYTPDQYLQQFRNINKDLNSLYQTKFVHGERLDTMKFYEGLKGKITETFEKSTPKEFADLFKETNKDFSQLNRLERFNQIMEKITENGIIDAKKLNSYITDTKKANILRKQIGNDGFEKLKLISNDLSKVQNKLKLVEEIGVKDIVKSALTLKILTSLKVPFGPAVQATKKGMELARGYILTSPQGTRDVQNFLRSVHSGNKKAILNSVRQMDEHVQKYEKESNPTK